MYRIKKYKQGWIVEKQVYKWHIFFGIVRKWRHVTHWAGLPENPFYYDTPEKARDAALLEIKQQIDFNFFYPHLK